MAPLTLSWLPGFRYCRSSDFVIGVSLWCCALIGCILVLCNLKKLKLGPDGFGNPTDSDYDYDEKWSWDRDNLIGILLSVLVFLTSGPGGNGGGTFLVPLFNILLGFSIKEAAAITACVMAFGALTAVMCAVAERHPNHPDRPIVDYRTVLLICPPMLFGISVGVMGNAVLPTWLVTYLMIGVFCLGTQKVASSYWTLFMRERSQKQQASLKQREEQQQAAAGEHSAHPLVLPASNAPHAPHAAYAPAATMLGSSAGAISVADAGGTSHSNGTSALERRSSSHSTSEIQRLSLTGGSSYSDRQTNVPAAGAGGTLRRVSLTSDLRSRAEGPSGGEDERDWLLVGGAAMVADEAGSTAVKEVQVTRRASGVAADGLDGAAGVGDACGATEARRQGGGGRHVSAFDVEEDPHGGRHAQSSCWSRTPKRSFGLLFVFIGIFIGLELLRGKQVACSRLSWGLLVLEGASSVLLSLVVALPIVLKQMRLNKTLLSGKEDEEAPLMASAAALIGSGDRQPTLTSAEDAVQWTSSRLLYMPLGMFVAGMFAGLLGLGGGFITMPLLLTLGLHPQVTAASSKVILLISTANTSLAYLMAGRLNVVYAVVFGMINLLVSPVGIFLMNQLIKATGRPSHLVLLTLVRFALGTLILIAVNGVQRTLEILHGHVEGFDWKAACKAGHLRG